MRGLQDKYSFDDQLLIYAQRQDATACATMELWNNTMHRWVRAHSKSIAVIRKDGGGTPKLELLFDYSDTRPVRGAREPWLWQLQEEHHAAVIAALERRYGPTEAAGTVNQLMDLAEYAVREVYRDRLRDLAYDVGDSLLEELDELNLEVRFRNLMTASVQYTLLKRCGFDPMDYLEDDDLAGIMEFSTPAVLHHLGEAVSTISKDMLVEIGRAIRGYEQDKIQQKNSEKTLANSPVIGYTEVKEEFNTLKRESAERSEKDGADLHENGRLPDPRPDDGRGGRSGGNAAGQVRDAAADVFRGTAPRDVHLDAADGAADAASAGDRPAGAGTGGQDRERADEAERRERGAESQRSDGVGAGGQQLHGTGRGDGADGDSLQVTTEHEENEAAGDEPAALPSVPHFTLFPPVEEQIERITEAQAEERRAAEAPTQILMDGADRIPDAVIGRTLTAGGNGSHSIERIVAHFQKDLPIADSAEFLREEFGTGGKGVVIAGQKYALWYDSDGIHIAAGNRALAPGSTLVSWMDAANTVSGLLHRGMFAAQDKIDSARSNEFRELSEKLWYLHQDFSEKATGYLPSLAECWGHGFPEDTLQIAELLKNPEKRAAITLETLQFANEYAHDPELLRFHRGHGPQGLWARLTAMERPVTEFHAADGFEPVHGGFITEDEIDRLLTRGSDVYESKLRIYSYFKRGYDNKECADFLKQEYGVGGFGYMGYDEAHDSKGIKLRRGDEFSDFKDYDTVFLNWNQVRKRIQQLIDDGKYLNPKEQDYLHEYEVKQLARNVYSFQYYTNMEPMMNRSWDVEAGIRQILPILADPEKAKELYEQMFNTWASLRSDFPHYDALRVPLRDMGMYVRGEYSLFQPLPEEVLEAERRIRQTLDDNDKVSGDVPTGTDDQTVDLNKAARALARKQKPSANEEQSGQFSLFGGAAEGEQASMFDVAPEEHAPPAHPSPSAPQKAEAEAKKKYSLGYGYFGNGMTVWNSLEYEHGDYKTIAHIDPDRTVKFYDESLPEIIKKQIRTTAATSNYTISATQDAPVFSPSQLVLENGFTTPKGVTYHMGDILEGISERGKAASNIEIVGGNDDYIYVKLLLLPTQDPVEIPRREFEDHLDNGRFALVQEKVATEKVETGVPEEPAQPAPEKKRPGNSRVERNYRNFARQFPEIVSGEYRYLELRSGENSGYMPLIIQSIGENEIAIAHTYIQNGDIMYDPEMTFRIDPVEGTLEPLTYQQDALGLYQQVYPEPGKWIPRLRNDLSAFTDQWLKNIEVQGRARYRAIAVRDGEDVELSFDKDGNPIVEVDSSPPELDYNTVKEAHTNDLVLYQIGDNFELYGEDAREAARLLKLISRDTQQPVDYSGASSISFSIHAAAEIEVLRTTRDLTICTLDENGRREVRSLPSRVHESPTQAENPHPYKVGDTVYVERTEYQIRSIGTSSVDLIQHRQNSPPVIRMENIDTFERLLHLDSRNRDITDFLSDSPNWYDGDLEDVLTGDGGLLERKDKEQIAGWFRDGMGNSELARRMAMTYDNISETMTLVSGEVADYFTGYNGLEIEIQDKYNSKQTFSWDVIVPFLRAMYEQERGGFFREPVLPEPETTLAGDFEPEAAADGAKIPPQPDETPWATGAGAPVAAESAETPPVEPDLTPNVEQYAVLKAEYPDKLIGVQVGEYMMFYGKDAEEAAQALGTNLLTRDIPGLGETSVTGYRHGWQAALNKLLEHGNSVVMARPDPERGPDAPYEIIKERDIADFLPLGMELTIDGRHMKIDSVDYANGQVSLQDMELQGLYPIFRSEPIAFVRSYVEEAQQSIEIAAPPPKQEVRQKTVAVYRGGLPFDVEIQTLSVGPERHNFHITDDNLGVGGQKTKYQNNMAAIRTLKQIEAEGRLATSEEQEILSRYIGWGGIAQAFDPDNDKWATEYAELKELLTPEEYESARSTVLNAHYTSPQIIKAIYDAIERMDLQPGNVLEPSCGIGNFFGLLPASMSNAKLYGVELDKLTGRIAQQLYQQADITVDGFENTNHPDDFFDLAVGNVPFGEYHVHDKRYNKDNLLIHDYFITKTLDKVRPGGIVAFITSKGTMDKKNSKVRAALAQKADLLGAIRLPNNAFKANAGTDVTADILFFQRRDRAPEKLPEWVESGVTEDGVPLNSYYLTHPEMVLGKMSFWQNMYGNETETACLPIEGADLTAQLAEAVRNIAPPNRELLKFYEPGQDADDVDVETIPADPDVRNFSYTMKGGKTYFRENSRMRRVELGKTPTQRVHGMIAIRDSARKLIDLQLNGANDEEVKAEQTNLNRLYDQFTEKYGLLSGAGNRLAFNQDSSYPLLCSLEVLDEEGNLERKADMFTKRTIQQHHAVTSVDTAVEALAVSIGERACVDLGYMGSLLGGGDKIPQVVEDLKGVIFKDPSTGPFDIDEENGINWWKGWQTADEYLSGNVRQKLEQARTAAEIYPEFAVNVEALEKVQPKDLSASEISVRIGAPWIKPEYYRQFIFELLNTPPIMQERIGVLHSGVSDEWRVTNKSIDTRNNALIYSTYGTKRRTAYEIFENMLNQRDTRVFDTHWEDGKEVRVLNAKETAIAGQKQDAIAMAFQNWIFKDPERRADLTATYNRLFNSTRPREYNGEHIVFAGMNPEIRLEPHQRNAVARMLYGGNALLAHCVGAGKTFEMTAAAMESKRLGLCHKSLFVVPNHLTEQWGGDFLKLYPGAKVLVATKKDFEPKNRRKFCARIATGDYDAVIIGHSQFEKIPLSDARQKAILEAQIDEIMDAIAEAKAAKEEKFTIKQMERTRKNLDAKLKKLNDKKKDDTVTFEELGVDRLFVDEAHYYKNLFMFSKMRNVAGISQTEAQKSSDMFSKCRYLDEITGGKGGTFATGTPISNTMVELYTMMRYLQFDMLEEHGLSHFDDWAATFGEKVTAVELKPEGTGFRAKTRFARFYNLPELMNLWKEAADIQTADMLNLPVPEVEYITIPTEPSAAQKEMVNVLADRAEEVRKGNVDPSQDNMLKIVRC